jgi:apolipoprotein D and lipocalin family protein
MAKEFKRVVLILGSLFLLGKKSNAQELAVVDSVDLRRYVGTWYEIARLPNRFQDECAGNVTATYTMLENGEIKVVNRCRDEDGEMKEAEGRVRRASDDEPNSKLKVRFAPAFLSNSLGDTPLQPLHVPFCLRPVNGLPVRYVLEGTG